jgi:hypothetical protein
MSTEQARDPQATELLSALEQQLHDRIVAATAARREPGLRRGTAPRVPRSG